MTVSILMPFCRKPFEATCKPIDRAAQHAAGLRIGLIRLEIHRLGGRAHSTHFECRISDTEFSERIMSGDSNTIAEARLLDEQSALSHHEDKNPLSSAAESACEPEAFSIYRDENYDKCLSFLRCELGKLVF